MSSTAPWDSLTSENLLGKRKSQDISSPPSKKPKVNSDAGTSGVDEDGFGKVISRDEKRKQKKESARAAAKAKNPPALNYVVAGFRSGKQTTMASVRDLVDHIVTGSIPEPNWMRVENRSSAEHVVVLWVPGLLPEHLGLSPDTLKASQVMPFSLALPKTESGEAAQSRLPYMAKLFSNALPTRSPGDNYKFHPALNTFMSCTLPQKEKERRMKDKQKAFRKRLEDSKEARAEGETLKEEEGKLVFDPILFLLTPNQMIENDYPLPSYMPVTVQSFLRGKKEELSRGNKPFLPWQTTEGENLGEGEALKEGWRETERATEPPAQGKCPVLAIDCEMCMTTKGDELTRATAIDFYTGKVVFDELIKPEGIVTDYKTQWSGITEEMLSKATMTLAELQEAFLTRSDLMTPHTILLGHSLENDLLALKLRHPLIIDTSVLYPHARGRPSKASLKWLTGKWLSREIQNKGALGHDSEEDARACLDLLKAKCTQGPDYGETMEELETLFDRFSRHASNAADPGRTSLQCDYGNTVGKMKATRAFVCKNDDEVLQNMVENLEEYNFTFGRFFELSNALKWTTPRATDSKPLGVVEPEIIDADEDNAVDPVDDVEEAFAKLNDRLSKLHDSLPARTIFMLMTGNGDPRPVVKLNEKRRTFEIKYKKLGESASQKLPEEEKWTTQDERDLSDAVNRARFGMAFFCVKNPPK